MLALVLRGLVMLLVLAKLQERGMTLAFTNFMSIIVVLGVFVGFGSIDSLTICSFNRYKKIQIQLKKSPIIILVIAFFILLETKSVNILAASYYVGLSFWFMGAIRRLLPLIAEILSTFQSLFVWCVYYLLLKYENASFQILTMIYGIFCLALALIFVRLSNIQVPQLGDGKSFFKLSLAKISWDVGYTFNSRLIFILEPYIGGLLPIYAFIYLLIEMASAALGAFQVKFLFGKDTSDHKRSMMIFSASLLIFYTLVFFVINNIEQLEYALNRFGLHSNLLQSLRDEEINFSDVLVYLLSCYVLCFVAFGRYAYSNLGSNNLSMLLCLTGAIGVIFVALSHTLFSDSSIFWLNVLQSLMIFIFFNKIFIETFRRVRTV